MVKKVKELKELDLSFGEIGNEGLIKKDLENDEIIPITRAATACKRR